MVVYVQWYGTFQLIPSVYMKRAINLYQAMQGVVHRDLTSSNLLVTDKWEAKLADFNLSRAIGASKTVPTSGPINSPLWSAPERLAGQVCML